MKKADLAKYSYIVLIIILAYFSLRIILPFINYLLFSAILVLLFFPAYRWLEEKTGRPKLSSLILVLLVLLLLVVPSIFIGYNLVREAPQAYETFVTNIEFGPLQSVLSYVDPSLSVQSWISESIGKFRQFIFNSVPQFVSSATQVILGLFVMFFTMFFFFTRGHELLDDIKKVVPLSKKHQEALYKGVDHVIKGVIIGQVLLGLLQGFLGGVLFAVLGVENAIFWGFVMAVSSMIPFLGSAMVWLPAGLWYVVTGSPVQGIIILVVGAAIISQVDNLLRPYVVGRYAELHPALVLIGVIGGLSVFGVVGFIVGPLILALFSTFLKLYTIDA